MPVDRRAAFQLGLLLLAVPAQYFISKWMSTNESQRSYAIRNLVTSAVGFKEKYLSWKSWQRWCLNILSSVQGSYPQYGQSDDPEGESPAVEVMKFRDPKGYFGGSPEPRSPRPPHIKYRIGQVIKHKRWGYRGVIIGWDETARAPKHWFDANHPPDKPHWQTQPNYAILVDTRDRLTPQMTYVPEENFEILSNVKILHPAIDEYFESFDGAQYLPRPSLRAVYPHD